MFLFRKNVEPAEDAGEHEPIDVTNAAHDEEEVEKADQAEAHMEEEEVEESAAAADEDADAYGHEDADDAHRYAEEDEEDARADSEDARHTTREGTVPPLDERHIAHQHEHEVEAEEAAAAAAEANASAPSHSVPVPGLTMPRTVAGGLAGVSPHSNGNTSNAAIRHSYVQRRSSRGTTPRATIGQSPRSHSNGGHSYAGSAMSAEETAVVEQHYRRCSSVVQSARNIAARRASSVNGVVGSIDAGAAAAAARRRSGSMTAAEREAVERMMDNEFHRQEAAERSAQFSKIRETTLVETELAKEKASYENMLQRERERQAEIARRMSQREQRMAVAAQRRRELEEQRQQAILASVGEKDARYTMRDPYTVVAAQRRYRSPIAPSRRQSTPVYAQDASSRSPRDSRRASGAVNSRGGSRTHSANAEYRRNSAFDGEGRRSKPGIDMSRPKQCLPLDAWKTPEQRQKNVRAGTNANRCLPPGAWEAATVADHPRQWH